MRIQYCDKFAVLLLGMNMNSQMYRAIEEKKTIRLELRSLE